MKWEYLQPADRPVVDGLEKHEVVYAKNQPEYIPLRCLRANSPQCEVLSRWTLSPEARKIIADGGDIFLSLWTFGRPLQPIQLAVSADPEPWFFRHRMNIPEDVHLPVPEVHPRNQALCPKCGKYYVVTGGHCPGCGWCWPIAEQTATETGPHKPPRVPGDVPFG